MFAPLRTDRLVIRPLEPDDVAALHARCNDPEVARYETWELPAPIERAERIVHGSIELGGPHDGEWWAAAVVEAASGAFVGDVATRLTFGGRSAEIGYTLDPSHWGRGYATEATEALVGHLVDDLGVLRVSASLHPDNVASARVLERCGFRYEGRTRGSFWVGDERSDDALYGLLAEELVDWRSRPTAPPSRVELVEITSGNARAVRALETHHSQRAFVAPVLASFADALVPEEHLGHPVVPWLRAIEADGEPVGFVMVAAQTEHHPEPYLWRLLIDRRHQRRRIGARALDLVEAFWRDAGSEAIEVSWAEGHGSPRPFYEARGYVPTGEIEEGETVARLPLTTRSD
ncbi:MAG: GNAT family N-acetyltransferase [Actinomycetota bacterium]